MGIILKVFIEFVTVLLLFYVLFLCFRPWGMWDPWPGIKPIPPTLEDKSFNHWTIREVQPRCLIFTSISSLIWRAFVIVCHLLHFIYSLSLGCWIGSSDLSRYSEASVTLFKHNWFYNMFKQLACSSSLLVILSSSPEKGYRYSI